MEKQQNSTQAGSFHMELSTGSRKKWIQIVGIVYIILGLLFTALFFSLGMAAFGLIYMVLYGLIGGVILYFVNSNGPSLLQMNGQGIEVNSVSNKFQIQWKDVIEVNEVGQTLQFRKRSGGLSILSTKHMADPEIGKILDYIREVAPHALGVAASREVFAEQAEYGEDSFEETF